MTDSKILLNDIPHPGDLFASLYLKFGQPSGSAIFTHDFIVDVIVYRKLSIGFSRIPFLVKGIAQKENQLGPPWKFKRVHRIPEHLFRKTDPDLNAFTIVEPESVPKNQSDPERGFMGPKFTPQI